jgi:apolipoprotein N-acyltransferase
MASETREWSVPAPVRALLWWPAISFVLVVVDPEAATGVIVGAGLALAALGGLAAAAARRLRRKRESRAAVETTVEFPRGELPSGELPATGLALDVDLPTVRIARLPSRPDAA